MRVCLCVCVTLSHMHCHVCGDQQVYLLAVHVYYSLIFLYKVVPFFGFQFLLLLHHNHHLEIFPLIMFHCVEFEYTTCSDCDIFTEKLGSLFRGIKCLSMKVFAIWKIGLQWDVKILKYQRE